MLESGLVVNIKNDIAFVRFMRTSACGKCTACGLRSGESYIDIEVKNIKNAQIGDKVAVSIDTKKSLSASAIAYLIPLAMLILGLCIGGFINIFSWEKEVIMAICAIVFCALGFFILHFADNIFKKKFNSVYKMTEEEN